MAKLCVIDKLGLLKDVKKQRELWNLQFLLESILKDDECAYIHCSEEPDFKVVLNDSKIFIGVELIDCFVGEDYISAVQKDIKDICSNAIEELYEDNILSHAISDCPNYFIVKVYHDKFCDGYPKCDKKIIKQEVKNIIKSKITKCKDIECAVYISDIQLYHYDEIVGAKIDVHSSMLHFVPRIGNLLDDPVVSCIKKKEIKLSRYIKLPKNSDVESWWLCIVIPENAFLNPMGYHLPNELNSRYDKIFIVKKHPIGMGVYEL